MGKSGKQCETIKKENWEELWKTAENTGSNGKHLKTLENTGNNEKHMDTMDYCGKLWKHQKIWEYKKKKNLKH